MSDNTTSRTAILVLICVGMVIAVWKTGDHLRSRSAHQASEGVTAFMINHGSPLDRMKAEGGMYHGAASAVPVDVQPRTDIAVRDLKTYYSRRAYAGAPPMIPHEVDAHMRDSQSCNVCHEKGGFVAKYNAYTPRTPHPEYKNCLQCHVQATVDNLFKESEWTSVSAPALHRPMLPGGPPPIPHTLQLRENCLSCHSGPAAPLEIKTTHPERINCRQCHVPSDAGKVFSRTAPVMPEGVAATE